MRWREVIKSEDPGVIWELLYDLVASTRPQESAIERTQELFLLLLTRDELAREFKHELSDEEMERELISQLEML
jgi:hypothetical protein